MSIAILPVFIGFIFYYTHVSTIRREVDNSNFSALSHAVSELDIMSIEMENIAKYFSTYLTDFPIFQRTAFPNPKLSAQDQIAIAQQIRTYQNSLRLPATILIYIRCGAWLYTIDGAMPYNEFEASIRQKGDLTMSSFYSRINSVDNNDSFMLSHSFLTDKANIPNLMYIFSIPYLNVIPRITICFMVKNEDICSVLENYLGDLKGNLYIFNNMRRNLFHFETNSMPNDFTGKLLSLKGIGVQKHAINGTSYVIMRSVSENTGLTGISVMKERDFYFRIRFTQNLLLLSIAFLAFSGILASLLLARRNYRPLKRLMANIGDPQWKYEKSEETEFDFISKKLYTMEETNLILNRTLDVQRPMVVYSCISSLLKGDYATPESMDYYLKCANVNFIGPCFFVLIVAPSGGGVNESRVINRQVQIILSEIEENIVIPQCRFYSIELIPEHQVAVICNSLEKVLRSDEQNAAFLKNCCPDERETDIRLAVSFLITGYIRNKYSFGVKISAGRVQDSPFKINTSFLEAMVVMSDYLTGSQHIVTFEKAIKQESEQYEYPVIEQALYIQSIKQGNREMALKAVDGMAAVINRVEFSPIAQCLCFDVINMMIKISNQMGSGITKTDIKDLSAFTDMEFFWLKFRELTSAFCTRIKEIQEQKDSIFKSKIINFIKENFCSNQLNLQQMADNFDISPSHLSRLLKQETGHGFIEYVSMIRMDKVKELLITTDLKIKDIAAEVGYMDTASFLRKFRETEGITPGQFREKTRN
ncbi:MAG: helix-turn-helix transcriptional regulator [Treponema sp.]|jgi:AraC-like DNA-binding protein|nr:helix-turn-helix transcriptional regulator [Treponema sp.]